MASTKFELHRDRKIQALYNEWMGLFSAARSLERHADRVFEQYQKLVAQRQCKFSGCSRVSGHQGAHKT